MDFQKLALLIGLVSTCMGILIPLQEGQFQCMLIYSMGHHETVKIDINFPFVLNWDANDFYELTLRNTMTSEVQKEKVPHGRFIREIYLTQSTIYELCFHYQSSKKIPGEILVEYHADTRFNVNKDKIKIPQNILQLEHMNETYVETAELNQMAEEFIHMHNQFAEREQDIFEDHENTETKMIGLGIAEILCIFGVGAYQFWVLKNHIEQQVV